MPQFGDSFPMNGLRRLSIVAMAFALSAGGCAIVDASEHPPPSSSKPTNSMVQTPDEPTASSAGSVRPRSLADYPDETTTGVPEGIDLKPSGSRTITQDGTVIDGLEVTGTILVEAKDVVIRNTRILNSGEYAIRVADGGENLLVEDSEIDGQGKGAAAVAFSDYTLRRVHIFNVREGPRVSGGDVTIEDSFIHQLIQREGDHADVIQVVSGKNIQVRGNRLDAYNPDAGSLGNAAFMFGEDHGDVDDCLVEGNYLNGGNYTVNGGGGKTTEAACVFLDNSFGRDHRFGPAANLGDNVEWDASNLWIDTDSPIR